ncbi:MAG: 50S ribosomal protein L29 [Flavobacteriales bacterium]
MKFSELTALSLEELKAKASESKAKLSQMEMTHALSPIENPMEIRHLRRDIARILTAISAK